MQGKYNKILKIFQIFFTSLISTSFFCIADATPIFIQEIGGVTYPWDVKINPVNSTIAISDFGNKLVKIYDPINWTVGKTIGHPLAGPSGLWWNSAGNDLLISDFVAYKVFLGLRASLGQTGPLEELRYPYSTVRLFDNTLEGVTQIGTGDTLVPTAGMNAVYQYTNNAFTGGSGTETVLTTTSPSFIASDGSASGFVVTSSLGNRVSFYNSISSLNQQVIVSGSPAGIVINQGFIAVAHHTEHRVVIYGNSSLSTVKATIGNGTAGSGINQLAFPRGVELKNGVIMIADFNNHRVPCYFDPALWTGPGTVYLPSLNLGAQPLTLDSGYNLNITNTLSFSGTLTTATGHSLSAGTLSINGGVWQDTAGGISSFPITLSQNTQLNVSTGKTRTLLGVVSNTGTLTLNGGGQTNFTGGVVIANNATLSLGNNTSSSGNFTVNGTLNLSGNSISIQDLSGTTTGSISLGGGTLTVSPSNTSIFAGQIYSTGSVVKNGNNIQNLSSVSNSYAHNTIVNAGTLVLNGSNALIGSAGGSITVSGGTLLLSSSNIFAPILATLDGGTLDLNHTVQSLEGLTGNNSGAAVMIGNGELGLSPTANRVFPGRVDSNVIGILKKNSNFKQTIQGNCTLGSVMVNAGELAFENNNQTINSISGNGTLTFSSAALSLGGNNNNTFSGKFSTNSSVTKQGAGTITFTNANNVFDAWNIASGILEFSTNAQSMKGITGSGGLNLSGISLTVNPASDASYSGNISGTGIFIKAGNFTQTLLGTNTYTGGTTVSAGTLQGNTTSLQGNMTNSGIVVFDQSVAGTYGGVITGGVVEKKNVGVLTLSGANSIGELKITGGSVALTTNAQTVGLLSGNGNMNTAVNLTFGTGANATFDGMITGTGSLTKVGSGTQTFTAANNFGVLAVNIGAVQFSVNPQAVETLSGMGGILLNGVQLTIGNSNAQTFDGPITGTGGLLKTGSGEQTLTHGANQFGYLNINQGSVRLTTNAQAIGHLMGSGHLNTSVALTLGSATDATHSGIVSGTGSLSKVGIGTQALLGVNTYNGGTTVSQGILKGNASSLVGNIVNNASVIFNQTSSGTYAGNMSGTGALTKTGSDILVLTGTNTYTGGTTVFAGILKGNTTSLQGGITNSGMVVFDQSIAGTYAGMITGGVVEKQNAGMLTLSGTNNIGELKITGGSIALTTNDQTLGLLSGNGGLGTAVTVTLGAAGNATFGGNITGVGGIMKVGTGTQELLGTNTYTGGTTVSQGILTGNASSLVGNIINNAGVIFKQTSLGAYAGNMSGTGALTKIGSDVLVLTGTNTYTGGTTVSQGILQGNTSSLVGDIVNNAAVTFNQTSLGTYAGKMSGTGALTKTGSDVLVLTGTNTYTGGTTVSQGILQGTTTSLQGNITNNAKVIFDQNIAGTYSGLITGTGILEKQNIDTLMLTRANHLGTLQVTSGSVAFTTNPQMIGLLLGSGNVSTTVDVSIGSVNDSSFSGVLSGTGRIFKTGIGTQTFLGANTYTGGTTVLQGTLKGNTTSLQGDIINDGRVEFEQSALGTYTGNMSGTGILIKKSHGVLALTGMNTYTGGTIISEGVLQGNTMSLKGDITNTAHLVFDQMFDGVYAGAITGDGIVEKQKIGKLTLSGSNTIEELKIREGTVALTTNDQTIRLLSGNGDLETAVNLTFGTALNTQFDGRVVGTGGLTKVGTGRYTLKSANTVGSLAVNMGEIEFLVNNQTVGGLTGTGGVLVNSVQLTVGNHHASTFSGPLTGSGGLLKTGSGTQTLTNSANNFGYLNLSQGTVLLTHNTQTIGYLLGSGNLNTSVALRIGSSSNATYSGVLEGSGSLIKLGTGIQELLGANTYSGGTTVLQGVLKGNASSLQGNITNDSEVVFNQTSLGTYTGIMSGTGVLTKTGSDILVLTGANTYTGVTTVSAGTLQGNTTSLQGNITNDSVVVFDQTGLGTYAGNMNGIGILVKQNHGLLELTGTNTYSGGTLVSAGALEGNTMNLQGDIQNNAQLIFNQSFAGDYNGLISGNGSFIKKHDGILSILQSQLFTGSVNIHAGTIDCKVNDAFANSMNVQINSGGRLKADGLNQQLYNISGSGALEIRNQVLTHSVLVDSVFSGKISGDGNIIKQGPATWVLTGNNTYTGNIQLDDGTIVGNTNSLSSNVTMRNNASLIFDQENIGNYLFNLQGNGRLRKRGSGNLILSGMHSHTGGTTVEEGTLTVNGVLNHRMLHGSRLLNNGLPTIINPNAALTGTGVIYGGVINPGLLIGGNEVDPYGTLIVDGGYTMFPTSTWRVKIQPGPVPYGTFGKSSKLIVQNGDLRLNGTLEIETIPGDYMPGAAYDILDVESGRLEGALVSTPTNIGPYKAVVIPVVGITGDLKIFVEFEAKPIAFLTKNFSKNVQLIGNYLTGLPTPAVNSDLGDVLGKLTFVIPTEGLEDGLTQILGVTTLHHPNIASQQDFAGYVNEELLDRLSEFNYQNLQYDMDFQNSKAFQSKTYHSYKKLVSSNHARTRMFANQASRLPLLESRDKRFNTWVHSFKQRVYQKDTQTLVGTQPGFFNNKTGLMGGLDYKINHRTMVGIGGGRSVSTVNLNNAKSHNVIVNRFGTLYGSWLVNRFSIDASLLFSMDQYRMRQHVLVGPINRERYVRYKGTAICPQLKLGYALPMGNGEFTPSFGIDYLLARQKPYTSTEAKDLNIRVSSIKARSIRATAGFEMAQNIQLGSYDVLPRLWLDYVYKRTYQGTMQVGLVGQPGYCLLIRPDRHAHFIRPRLGIGLNLPQDISLHVNGGGEFGTAYRAYDLNFEVLWKF